MTLIMGVDPGKTTGVAVIETSAVATREQIIVWWAEVAFEDAPQALSGLALKADLIATERYFINAKTARRSRQPEAFYVIGGLVFLAALTETPLELQSAADAKNAFTDHLLTKMELLDKVRSAHARDGLRHALLAARRIGVAV